MNPFGELVAVDDETSYFSRLNFARLRIKTTLLDPVVFKIKIQVDGKMMDVCLVEELGQCEMKKQSSYDGEDDSTDWSQFEAKVPQSELVDSSSGEEEEVGGEVEGGVEQVCGLGIVNDISRPLCDGGPEGKEFNSLDECLGPENDGMGLGNRNQLVEVNRM